MASLTCSSRILRRPSRASATDEKQGSQLTDNENRGFRITGSYRMFPQQVKSSGFNIGAGTLLERKYELNKAAF